MTLLTVVLQCLLFRNIYADISLKPDFTRFPEDSYALPRKQLTLKCSATGLPFPTITWYKDGIPVQSQHEKPGTSNRIITQGDLLFLSFSPEDEGVYYCNASNIHGFTVSPNASVRIAFFNTDNVADPESKVVSVGDVVQLECIPPTGLPKPSYIWVRDGVPVVEDSRVTVQPGRIKFSPASLADFGKYQCQASNIAGSWTSKPSQLTVHKKPRFRSTPGDRQVIAGEDVELHCLASDETNSAIIWRRDVGTVPRTSFINRKSLRIEDVHLSDAGNYICEVATPTGILQAVSHLYVIAPPSFLVTPDDKEVSVGEDVVLHCLTSGSPPPVVRWLHSNDILWVPSLHEQPFNTGKYQLYPNGTLLIRSVSLADEGKYECKASQMARIEKSSAYLYVRVPGAPSIPLIEVGPQNQSVVTGTIVLLPCQATVLRYPFRDDAGSLSSARFSAELSIEWFIKGIRLTSIKDPRIVSFPSGSLQLNAVRPTDSGVYTCRADVENLHQPHNPVQSASWSATLRVTNPSESDDEPYASDPPFISTLLPPENLSVIEIGDTWAVFEVVSSTNINSSVQLSSLSGFRFELAEFGSNSGWWLAVPFTFEKKVRINNLRPRTSYIVLVRQVYHEIVGQPLILNHFVHTRDPIDNQRSVMDSAHFAESVRFSPVVLHPISPSEFIAEWSLCSSLGGIAPWRNFRATVRAVPLSVCLTVDRDRNVVLRDEPSIPETGCPTRSTHMENDDMRLPHCSILELPKNAALDRIPPQFLHKDITAIIEPFRPNSSLYRMVIESLRPFTCYTVQVTIPSSDGSNVKSSPTSVLTYDNLPLSPPKVFSARWLPNASLLEIGWNPPSEWEQGGVLTGYKLRVIASPPKHVREIKVSPELRTFQFPNLDPWTNYTIYLSALNCRGEGVRSLPVRLFAQSLIPTDTSSSVVRRVSYDGRPTVFAAQPQTPIDHSMSNDLAKDKDAMDSLPREPWFIIGVIAFVLLWVLIVIALVLCGRHRSRRQRRSPGSPDMNNAVKNGRIITAGSNFGTSAWTLSGQTEAQPLVHEGNLDGLYYGEKPTAANGYHALLTPNDGLLAHSGFGTMPVSVPMAAPGFAHSPQFPLGPRNNTYVSAGNLPVVAPSNIQHPLQSPIPATLNGQPPVRYDRPTNSNAIPVTLDEEDEDTVTPYASVPVMQQMLRYDPCTNMAPMSGPRQPRQPDLHRQLSLAKIIPPPPDYPPPSLPSGSPPLPPTPTNDHPAVSQSSSWARTPGSGSGEDSAYYAQSELQAPTPSQHSNRGQSKQAAPQWSREGGSLPASDESAAFLPHDLSHHSGSQLFARNEAESALGSSQNPLAAGLASS